MWTRTKINPLIAVVVAIGLLALLYSAQYSSYTGISPWTKFASFKKESSFELTSPAQRRASWGGLRSQGQKASFRENLKPGEHYILGYYFNGFNNQVICVMHLLYLAQLSNRTPILSKFSPMSLHLGGGEQTHLSVSDVFDLTRYSVHIDKPVVELWELKGPENETVVILDEELYEDEEVGTIAEYVEQKEEMLGCWSTKGFHKDDYFALSERDKIFIEVTPLPDNAVNGDEWPKLDFPATASLMSPKNPLLTPSYIQEILDNKTTIMPDLQIPRIFPKDHVTCIDDLYEANSHDRQTDLFVDVQVDMGPWKDVGKHLRWNRGLEKLAESYLRVIFGVEEGEPLPKFTAIHIRRTDMLDQGNEGISLRKTAWEVSKAIKDAQTYSDISSEHVVVMTDELDKEWLKGLDAYGWKRPDHEAMQTIERYGNWYPTLLDAVMMSLGNCFIGNRWSTRDEPDGIWEGHRVAGRSRDLDIGRFRCTG